VLTVVEFVANVHTLALPIEIGLVPVFVSIAAARPLAETNAELKPAAAPPKALKSIAVALILGLLPVAVAAGLTETKTHSDA
jgi:cytochrome c biogenesis protein CcdA